MTVKPRDIQINLARVDDAYAQCLKEVSRKTALSPGTKAWCHKKEEMRMTCRIMLTFARLICERLEARPDCRRVRRTEYPAHRRHYLSATGRGAVVESSP